MEKDFLICLQMCFRAKEWKRDRLRHGSLDMGKERKR